MNLRNILAEADLGTLIYIVLVFFWVVGNLFGKSKRKQQKRGGTPVPRPGESTAEAELRKFLEQISGRPVDEGEEEEERSLAPQPAPQRTSPRARPVRTQRTAQRPPPPPPATTIQPRKPVYTPLAPPVREPEINIEELAAKLRDGAPSMAGSFSTTLSSMASMFKTSGITMPSLRYALSTPRPRPAKPVVLPETLKNRNDLRRLVAGRIILGPPRAMEPYQPDTEATRSPA